MNLLYKCFLYSIFFCCLEAQLSFTSRCTYPHVEHARVKLRSRTRMAKFTCYPGYTLVGTKYVFCNYGRWEEPFPVCVKSGCEPMPLMKNGVILSHHNSALAMVFCYSGFELQGSQTVYCNGYRWNDTAPTCVEKGKNETSVKYKCDFEQDLCGWVQDELHDFDWTRLDSKTPSFFALTGPFFDHTYGVKRKGHYMYIESTNRNVNDTARLISPVYDAAVAKDGCFQIFYHMYGRSIGGIRVYEIPDNVTLSELSEAGKQKYIIFEKWGNLGNQWFSSVSMLKDFGNNFQIVIEGIRGFSFMSDLAFDDVAILRGENCTEAASKAVTPFPYKADSCEGRCFQNVSIQVCGCAEDCVVFGYCCQDFIDTCIDTATETTNAETNSEELPQTQKLVASTTTTKATTTTPKPTTPKTTTKTVPTTKKTVRIPTTPKPNTTPKKIATTMKTSIKEVKTTIPSTTTKTTVSTTIKIPTTTSTTTKKIRKNTDTESTAKKMKLTSLVTNKSTGTSKALSVTGTTITIFICIIVVIGSVLVWRRYGGMMIVRRLRGQATGDSEVRYLTTHEDD